MSIDYLSCAKILYPGLTDTDLVLSSLDGETITITYWNTSFGPAPTLSYLETAYLSVVKNSKLKEFSDLVDLELKEGSFGYTTQGLSSNFKMNSSRGDLDNLKNLNDYLCSAILNVINSSECPPPGTMVRDSSTGAAGTIEAMIQLGGDLEQGTGICNLYLSKCYGVFDTGSLLIHTTDIQFCEVNSVVKENEASTKVRDFNNQFHVVSLAELNAIILELRAYGLWLFKQKWAKEVEINMATSVEQVEAINFWT
jgi:hypothetical protein